MKRSHIVLNAGLVALTFGFAVGCDRKDPPPAPAKPDAAANPGATPPPAGKPAAAPDKPASGEHAHDHDHDDHGHGHGEEVQLGSVTIAGFNVKVVQQGKVEAGKDAAFAFEVSGGVGKPAAVRAWIGSQDAAGSVKAKADAEEHGFHVHVEAPQPLPSGSQLWIEVEDAKGVKTLGSVALK